MRGSSAKWRTTTSTERTSWSKIGPVVPEVQYCETCQSIAFRASGSAGFSSISERTFREASTNRSSYWRYQACHFSSLRPATRRVPLAFASARLYSSITARIRSATPGLTASPAALAGASSPRRWARLTPPPRPASPIEIPAIHATFFMAIPRKRTGIIRDAGMTPLADPSTLASTDPRAAGTMPRRMSALRRRWRARWSRLCKVPWGSRSRRAAVAESSPSMWQRITTSRYRAGRRAISASIAASSSARSPGPGPASGPLGSIPSRGAVRRPARRALSAMRTATR